MANKLSLYLFIISIICGINSEVIDCGTANQANECNCSSIATPGETCTLNCNEKDLCKGKTLNCRANDPCHIKCTSKTACSNHTIINADTASDVTITCNGEDACKTDINIKCGIGKCKLECITNTSCTDWGYINTTRSSGFTCFGLYCPQSLPSSFSSSPTNFPTISPTSDTSNPTNYPTVFPTHYPSKNPSKYPTNFPTISPTSNTSNPTNYPSIFPTIYPTYFPTYFPTHYPSTNPTISPSSVSDETSNKLRYKTVFNFQDHKYYLQDPLFYMILVLFVIIFCGCCFFCIWIYAHDQKQKRMQRKLKSNIILATETENININNKNNNHSNNKNKRSLDSSDLYTKKEGPMSTYLNINTMPSDGNPTHPLPLPPPRKSFSPVGIISNYSSPPQTPIPLTPNENDNENDNNVIPHENQDDIYCDIKHIKELDNIQNNQHHHHGKYSSLPTVPSLPITPEHSIYVSSPEHSVDINSNNNNVMFADSRFTVSMVSCMAVFEDSKNEEHEEDSESIEYQSYRKKTFESYDMGNNSPFSKSFHLANKSKSNLLSVNTEFDISCIRKASTMKLPNIEESRSSVVSDFSETSVMVDVMSDVSGSIAK